MVTSTIAPLCTHDLPIAQRIDTDALPALLDRFVFLQSQCIDPDTFDRPDFALWQALDGHARHGGSALDLREHGTALARVPAELMEAFFDVCRCQPLPLQAMHLPDTPGAMPGWLAACPDGVLIVQETELPD
jgi:hypothetical protein